jgi:cold shock protein
MLAGATCYGSAPAFYHKRGLHMREKGIVKRYFDDRGFGFIARESGCDLFFHIRDVEGSVASVTQGAAVEFAVTISDRGPRAANVVLL